MIYNMKYLRKYNESIRDQMKAKSEEDVDKAIQTAPIEKVLDMITSQQIPEDKIPSVEEIKNRLKEEETIDRWIYLVTDRHSLGKYFPTDEEIEEGLRKLSMEKWLNSVAFNKSIDKKFLPTREEVEKEVSKEGKAKVYDVYCGSDCYVFKTPDGKELYLPYISVIARNEIDAMVQAAEVVGQDFYQQYIDNPYENWIGHAEYKYDY